MKTPFFFVLLALSVSYPSLAQRDYKPGYIIKISGDSVAGFIDYRIDKKAGAVCSFKDAQTSDPVQYSTGEIKAYGFVDDIRFELKTIKLDSVEIRTAFFQILVKGPMSLYRYDDKFYVEKDNILTLLPPDAEVKVYTDKGVLVKKDTRYVGLLNQLMVGCRVNTNEARYHEKSLTKLIHSYNQCKGLASSIFQQKNAGIKFNTHVFSGVDLSSITYKGFNSKWDPSYSSIVGIGFDLSSNRLCMSFEAAYLKKSYYSKSVLDINTVFPIRDTYTYSIDISFVKIPIGLKYNFRRNANTPYVIVGYSQYLNIKNSSHTMYERRVDIFGRIEVSQKVIDSDLVFKNPNGYWLALGYNKKIIKRYSIFSELRVEKANGFIGSNFLNPESHAMNYNLLVGIRF